VGKEAGAWR